ncbi:MULTISPECIES: deoxynucleoside kinase [unclassified Gemella]|uniref:deoxynucleoside kinase n=1 Tax=unclassified Gemella TaxID=2624949 RepID=UPI001C54CB30|nr:MULTISPECIES: deoxynucleoside kinase [unclassified Gemella]
MVLVLGGTVGSGKSTVSKRLSDELGTKLMAEPVEENPILDKYYADRKRYGFLLQIYFLNKRFKLIKEALDNDNNVLDRSIYEDALFALLNYEDGNMSVEEYNTYIELLDNMMEELKGMPKKSPDLLIYLDITFDKMIANIKKRGRPYEQCEVGSSLYKYYQRMHSKYVGWYESYNKGPKIKIDMNNIDVNKEEDWQLVFEQIKTKLKI